jgi:nitrogen fixation protein FixH
MNATANESCRIRPLTGRFVLLCLIAFFAVISLANGIMIRAAVTSFGGVETASSYQAGLAYARESAAAKAQDALRWQVKAAVQPAGAGTLVEITARDARGAPLSGLQASAVLSHPTDRRADRVIALHEDAAGRFRGTTDRMAGQWDVVVELSRGAERLFRSRNRIVLQ